MGFFFIEYRKILQ